MAVVHVAVAVIQNTEGQILITRRADDAHQGGLWEFPGGKVEVGEQVADALDRELQEELGIRVDRATPMLEVRHDYSDKSVCLDVWLVNRFSGEATGLEGQPLCWCSPQDLHNYAFPAANTPIVDACLALAND